MNQNQPFSIICLHVLDGCHEDFRKILKEDEFYFFSNKYLLLNGTVQLNKEYSLDDDFFGHNILIHAVVGKNGSGKSSLFELMYRIVNNLSYVATEGVYRATAERLYYIRGIRAELYYEMDDSLYCISCIDDKIEIKKDGKHSLTLFFPGHKNYEDENEMMNTHPLDEWGRATIRIHEKTAQQRILHSTLDKFFYTLVVNYSMQSLSPCDFEDEEALGDDEDDYCEESWLTNIYKKNDGYIVPFGIEPYRGDSHINLRNQRELTEDRLVALLIEAADDGNVEVIPGFLLAGITYEFQSQMFRPNKHDEDNPKNRLIDIINRPLGNRCTMFMDVFGIPTQATEDDNAKKELWQVGMMYLMSKCLHISTTYPTYEEFAHLEEFFFEDEEDLHSEELSLLETLLYKIDDDNTHISLKVKQVVSFLRGLEGITDEEAQTLTEGFEYKDYASYIGGAAFIDESLTPLDKIVRLYPPSIFKHRIYLIDKITNDKVEFSKLSSGQRQYAYSLAAYIYHLRNLISIHGDKDRVNYHCVNLVFDEIELCYHPEYQRIYIHNLILALEHNHITEHLKVNIIVSTHSPFVLSDIPMDNILFLENGVTKNKEMAIIPFAANVNELLCHSFFMGNGFIGEFAKRKIQSMASYLLGNTDEGMWNAAKCSAFIESIGDIVIKRQLQVLYEKRFGDSTEEYKNWIRREANRLGLRDI